MYLILIHAMKYDPESYTVRVCYASTTTQYPLFHDYAHCILITSYQHTHDTYNEIITARRIKEAIVLGYVLLLYVQLISLGFP